MNVSHINIGVDIGTTKAASTFSLGGEGSTNKIADVIFADCRGIAANRIAFVEREGQVVAVFGDELEKMVENGEVPREDVVEYFKILFYNDLADTGFAKRVTKKLMRLKPVFGLPDDASLHEAKIYALALFLKSFLAQAEKAIRDSGPLRFQVRPADIANYPRRIFISVPGIWSTAACKCITEAAELAEYPSVELVYEPQAAGTYWLHQLRLRGEGNFDAGDHVLVLDGGGGTSDLIVYELQSTAIETDGYEVNVDGEQSPLKLVPCSDASGALCGSEFINQSFIEFLKCKIRLKYLKKEYTGGMEGLLPDLGMSEDEFTTHAQEKFNNLLKIDDCARRVKKLYRKGFNEELRKLNMTSAEFLHSANTQFRVIKNELKQRDLDEGSTKKWTINIHGTSGDSDEETEDDYIHRTILRRHDVWNFCEPNFQENFDLVRGHLQKDPAIKAVVVIGGISRCAYFMSRLKQKFAKCKQLHTPGGGPNKSTYNVMGGFESTVGELNEVARGMLHQYSNAPPRDLPSTDVYLVAEEQEYDEKVHGDEALASPYLSKDNPGKYFVSGRVKTVVCTGTQESKGQLFHLRKGRDSVEVQLYWSSKPVPENSALFIPGSTTKTVPGVEPYGGRMKISIPVDKLERDYPMDFLQTYCKPFGKIDEGDEPEEEIKTDIPDDSDDEDYQELSTTKKLPKSAPGRGKKRRARKIKTVAGNRSKRPSKQASQCSNCGKSAILVADNPDKVCADCDRDSYRQVLLRFDPSRSGANVSMKVVMAKPHRLSAALDGEELGENDIIELVKGKNLAERSFNPTPRD